MMVEGVYLCVKVVSVFDTSSKKKQYIMYGGAAWGKIIKYYFKAFSYCESVITYLQKVQVT